MGDLLGNLIGIPDLDLSPNKFPSFPLLQPVLRPWMIWWDRQWGWLHIVAPGQVYKDENKNSLTLPGVIYSPNSLVAAPFQPGNRAVLGSSS